MGRDQDDVTRSPGVSTQRCGLLITMMIPVILGYCAGEIRMNDIDYIYIDAAVSSVAADTRVLASFPVPSTPGLISETASAPEVNPGLLDSFFYKDLEATDANAFPSSPVQVEER